MKVQVFVRGLVLHSYHGVTAEERETGQELKVDICCTVNESASVSDDVGQTVDYVALATLFETVCLSQSRSTLEYVGSRFIEACLSSFYRVVDVEVTLTKVGIPLPVKVEGIGVILYASRTKDQ